MTLSQMVAEIYSTSGVDLQVSPSQIMSYISIVQMEAFCHDCEAFQEKSQRTYDSGNPTGPFPFPGSARVLLRIEDLSGNSLPCTISPIRKTVTLASDPGADWKYVYLILPEQLESESDDEKVLIPVEWHHSVLVQGAIALCNQADFGEQAPIAALEVVFRPFWDAMDAAVSSTPPSISVGAW